jgi:hypothetical protein
LTENLKEFGFLQGLENLVKFKEFNSEKQNAKLKNFSLAFFRFSSFFSCSMAMA